MKRVCLIVDHPLRDLEGLVLLTTELLDHNVEVFLVPMYQRHEVFWLQPDLVVVNYVRFANVVFVEACNRAGILVAVLDTEGGVLQDLRAFADRVARHLDKVALYCVWGRQQRDALVRHTQGGRVHVVATGSPRHDFAVPPLINAVREPRSHLDGIVLVNTNFPIINPKFQSVRRELHDLIHGMGYDEGFIYEFIRQSQIAQAELLDAVRALAARFASVPFVVRPHPFEDARTYVKLLAHVPNVQVIQAGTVLEWIRRASVVLHYSCSTAIETFLMGKEPVSLRWIPAPLLEQPLSIAVSLSAHSLEELTAVVAEAVAGKALAVPSDVLVDRRRVSEGYFCHNDGRAASRVAAAVEALLLDRDGDRLELSGRIPLIRAQPGLRAKLSLVLAMMLGTPGYDALRQLLGRRSAADAKWFGVSEVAEILGRLARIRPRIAEIRVAKTADEQTRVRALGRYASVYLRRESVGAGRLAAAPNP